MWLWKWQVWGNGVQAIWGKLCFTISLSLWLSVLTVVMVIYLRFSVMQDKEKVNSGNKYSHNFFGLYCTCDRPYPDPEDEVMCILVWVAFYNVFLSPIVLLSDHILYCIHFKIINPYSNLNSACDYCMFGEGVSVQVLHPVQVYTDDVRDFKQQLLEVNC